MIVPESAIVSDHASWDFISKMVNDGHDYPMFSPISDRAMVIGRSKAHDKRDTSLVYCLKVRETGEVAGPPFRLHNQQGDFIWENIQLRNASIQQGSIISFERRKVWGFQDPNKPCYAGNTGKVWETDTILSQLESGGSGNKAVVYQGFREVFPDVNIEDLKVYQDAEDGPSPSCALIKVKEATLVDRQIRLKTLLNEECVLRNNCQNNRGSGVDELPLHIQVSSSNHGTSNCVLLVKFGDLFESEYWDSGRYYAVCEAIVITQPGLYAQGGRKDSSDGILAGSSLLKSYEMNRNPRGKCIILNNTDFCDETLNRRGAELDEQALKSLFENFSFEVEIYKNSTSREMRDLAEAIASWDHNKYDAFFFVIMSHGGEHDTIFGTDARTVTMEEMMSEFKADRCKTLVGKPKVFIVQACRGTSSESLVPGNRHIDSTLGRHRADSTLPRGTSPREADFLLAFATTPGYYSYRYEGKGSPFIQTLVDVIREHHQDNHLTEMLPEVTQRVVEKAEEDGLESYIQVPSYSNSLRAKLYLRVDHFTNCKAEN